MLIPPEKVQILRTFWPTVVYHHPDRIRTLEQENRQLADQITDWEGKAAVNTEQMEEDEAKEEDRITHADLLALSDYIPPAHNLERAYTYDRQVFFLNSGLSLGDTLSDLLFKQVWESAEELKQEDLLTEIIIHGDLQLEDYAAAYWTIGDLGARLLRYYAQVEEAQAYRHQLEVQYSEQIRQPQCIE